MTLPLHNHHAVYLCVTTLLHFKISFHIYLLKDVYSYLYNSRQDCFSAFFGCLMVAVAVPLFWLPAWQILYSWKPFSRITLTILLPLFHFPILLYIRESLNKTKCSTKHSKWHYTARSSTGTSAIVLRGKLVCCEDQKWCLSYWIIQAPLSSICSFLIHVRNQKLSSLRLVPELYIVIPPAESRNLEWMCWICVQHQPQYVGRWCFCLYCSRGQCFNFQSLSTCSAQQLSCFDFGLWQFDLGGRYVRSWMERRARPSLCANRLFARSKMTTTV